MPARSLRSKLVAHISRKDDDEGTAKHTHKHTCILVCSRLEHCIHSLSLSLYRCAHEIWSGAMRSIAKGASIPAMPCVVFCLNCACVACVIICVLIDCTSNECNIMRAQQVWLGIENRACELVCASVKIFSFIHRGWCVSVLCCRISRAQQQQQQLKVCWSFLQKMKSSAQHVR